MGEALIHKLSILLYWNTEWQKSCLLYFHNTTCLQLSFCCQMTRIIIFGEVICAGSFMSLYIGTLKILISMLCFQNVYGFSFTSFISNSPKDGSVSVQKLQTYAEGMWMLSQHGIVSDKNCANFTKIEANCPLLLTWA